MIRAIALTDDVVDGRHHVSLFNLLTKFGGRMNAAAPALAVLIGSLVRLDIPRSIYLFITHPYGRHHMWSESFAWLVIKWRR